jgi:hypothetical protein
LILDYFFVKRCQNPEARRLFSLFSLAGWRPQPESHFWYLRSNVYFTEFIRSKCREDYDEGVFYNTNIVNTEFTTRS